MDQLITDQLILVIVTTTFVVLAHFFTRQKPKPDRPVVKPLEFIYSKFQFSVYQFSKINGSKSLILVLEGNRIDELGYQIYKFHTADLDTIDILIRDNVSGKIMKIVKDSDSESMIGVSHPEHGHIGFLQIEAYNVKK